MNLCNGNRHFQLLSKDNAVGDVNKLAIKGEIAINLDTNLSVNLSVSQRDSGILKKYQNITRLTQLISR